ncbi:uncharacterized protein (UPF0262 family) [Methylopila capsulata]|uniref:UPF0262 protein GCM10008170_31450 n=1 Tax=Methylopila capsulata TaxID=61654 RepID=A0A9W6IXW5_9HYPH|nr:MULTISPECIES: UPF0262 family protein [Methylopila]MBM7852915.1 uncharacterized protein (UPF0262 family) [Methylopila capsulata]GLK57126.1 UPF0262 protein [Methylopila capsulata]
MSPSGRDPKAKLVAVTIDDASIGRAATEVEHERQVAIYDLVEDNAFQPIGGGEGPFKLDIALIDRKLALNVRRVSGEEVVTHFLSLTPFLKLLKDYFLICESYYTAIRSASPSQIEAIDMGRRGLHDEGAQLLAERLDGKIALDHDTARRLFTLIAALSWKG